MFRAVYLCVIVEVPEVEMTNSIHTGKQGGVDGRPHDVIDVVRVVLEGVQGLVILQGTEKTRI